MGTKIQMFSTQYILLTFKMFYNGLLYFLFKVSTSFSVANINVNVRINPTVARPTDVSIYDTLRKSMMSIKI